MGVINCPDCGRKVSLDATACPHCGCPGLRIREKSGCLSGSGCLTGLIVSVVIIFGAVVRDKSSEAKEQSVEVVTPEDNETRETQTVYEDEYGNPFNGNDEEIISHDEILESPESRQDEISEIIATDEVENSSDISED